MGGQPKRLLAAEPVADLGPALASGRLQQRDVLLDRFCTYLAIAWGISPP